MGDIMNGFPNQVFATIDVGDSICHRVRQCLIGADGLAKSFALTGIGGGQLDGFSRQTGKGGGHQQFPFFDRLVEQGGGVIRFG